MLLQSLLMGLSAHEKAARNRRTPKRYREKRKRVDDRRVLQESGMRFCVLSAEAWLYSPLFGAYTPPYGC